MVERKLVMHEELVIAILSPRGEGDSRGGGGTHKFFCTGTCR